MKAGKIVAVVLILLLSLGILIVGGQYAAGYFLLSKLGLDPKSVSITTFYDYWSAYRHMGGPVGKFIKIATGIAAAPIGMIVVMAFAALLTRKGKIDKLYGDARWATPHEIAKAEMFLDEKKDSNWPPVLLGKLGKRFVVDSSQEYTTLSAAPGARKGVSFVVPNLLHYNHSVLNFDPKLENFRLTAGWRQKGMKQDVFLFCPDNTPNEQYGPLSDGDPAKTLPPNVTHCWNPMDYISDSPLRTLFDIKTITSILIAAPEGQNQGFYMDARKALDGILLYLMETPEEERTLYNASVINDTPIGINKWAIKTIAEREKQGRPLSDQCIRLLMSYANEEERKRGITRGIVSTTLEPFTDPYSRAATRKSDFSFHDLRRKRMTIYVGIAPSNIPKFQKMLNLFFAQAISVNTNVLPEDGPKDSAGNPVLKYQCLFLLDEFVALGPIEIIRASSGYTRAYNVRYAIIFQNKSQVFADECYGSAGGKSLLDTFHNEIVFATESTEEAEDYSKRLGNTTLKHVERNRSRSSSGTSTSDSTQRHSRALMLPQEIQRLDYDKEILFKKGGKLRPILLDKIIWYQDEYFAGKAKLPLPHVPAMVFAETEHQTATAH